MKQLAITRPGGLRAVAMFMVNIAEALIAILLLPAVLLYPSASRHRPDVVVHDEVDIYREQILRRGLEEQHYDHKVRIMVLSIPGAGIGNLGEEIVKYAADGAQGSSWFQGSDVGSSVDGAVFFVVAPESHWMRCHVVKDLRLSANKREAIENAAGSRYAQDDWDGGAVAMGQQLATYTGLGDGSSTMMRVVDAALAFMMGNGWLAFYMRRGVTGRRLGRAAHKKMMQAVYDYDLTELKAETLLVRPSQSRDIGSDHRRFPAEYDVVSKAWRDLGEPCSTQRFGRGVRAQVARFVERIASLAELDAAVNASAATRANTIQNPGGIAL